MIAHSSALYAINRIKPMEICSNTFVQNMLVFSSISTYSFCFRIRQYRRRRANHRPEKKTKKIGINQCSCRRRFHATSSRYHKRTLNRTIDPTSSSKCIRSKCRKDFRLLTCDSLQCLQDPNGWIETGYVHIPAAFGRWRGYGAKS